MDINRQIDYWQSGATNDIETAELLINTLEYLTKTKEIVKWLNSKS